MLIKDWFEKYQSKQKQDKGSRAIKKTVKKGDIVPFRRTPPPKRVKRGHLSSENIKLI